MSCSSRGSWFFPHEEVLCPRFVDGRKETLRGTIVGDRLPASASVHGSPTMSLSPADRKFVDAFFAEVAPIEKAYEHTTFNYVALQSAGRFVILQGQRTALPPARLPSPARCFRHFQRSDCGIRWQ